MLYLAIYLVFINILAFVLYGLDKRFAKHRKNRIPERTLLMVAFLGGPIGALFGMTFFRHKTKKPVFITLIPLALVVWVAILYFVLK